MINELTEFLQPDFLERHYTISELAERWHMSKTQVREWFVREPDIIRWGTGRLNKNRKRTYVSLRIPESVARRVYERKKGDRPKPHS
jgi:hypothetical protein